MYKIYGDFPETYRIVIGYTEMDMHNIKQPHVFSSYKTDFVRLDHKLRILIKDCENTGLNF